MVNPLTPTVAICTAIVFARPC